MTAVDLKGRVAAGVAWLDEHEPGWHSRIDANQLHMDSADWCVLGQLDGGGDIHPGFDRYLHTHDLDTVWARDHGVYLWHGDYAYSGDWLSDYDRLNALWREVISARQSADRELAQVSA